MLQDEADERKMELAKKVESATFEQIEAQISDDMDLLRKELPTPVSQAVETARDMKYVRERQALLALNFSRNKSFIENLGNWWVFLSVFNAIVCSHSWDDSAQQTDF